MNKYLSNSLLLTVWLVIAASGVSAQQNTTATGGEAKGDGGSISYSIGQIDYTNQGNSTGLITQGLQQPAEIFVYIGDHPVIIDQNPEFSVYPNPTRDFTVLHVKYSVAKKMSYILYDMLGRIVSKQQLINVRTIIRLDQLPSAVYILTVVDDSNSKVITQFKIIKII